MDGEGHTYSRDQVKLAERKAWTANGGSYHFDGIYFWRLEGPSLLACDEASVPSNGWRHSVDCCCELCRLSGDPSRSS